MIDKIRLDRSVKTNPTIIHRRPCLPRAIAFWSIIWMDKFRLCCFIPISCVTIFELL